MAAGEFAAIRASAPRRAFAVRHARAFEMLYGAFNAVLTLAGPLVRLLPQTLLERLARPVERTAKQALFGCRMCGTCTLSSTGMSCPMNCPKTLRNGPCGGVREGGLCEIIPDMRCVWLNAWDGASAMHHGEAIRAVQPPLNRALEGRSTWLALAAGRHPSGRGKAPEPRPARPASGAAPAGSLETRFATGRFCVTSEFNPPDTADPQDILARAAPLLEVCDSVNITDGAGANTHISSLSVAALLAREGHDPVMQISCRDRNRIAIQADALGAAALGIRNILCLSGDGMKSPEAAEAKAVFDLDCTSLLALLGRMRDEAEFATGRKIARPPSFFLGATSNPCALPPEVETGRLAKKLDAGAQFIQTQYVFDMEAFRVFHARFLDQGLHERCRFMVGVGPLNSARAGEWMRNNIAGLRIPDATLARLAKSEDEAAEGVRLCAALAEELKAMPGISGIHIMAFQQPGKVRRIVELAKLGR